MINKKTLLIFGMAIFFIGVVYASGVLFFGSNAYNDNNDGLVLDLNLKEANYISATKTFTDNSGQGNNGVASNNATFTTDKYGKSTGAVSFDGTTSSIINGGDDLSLNITTNSFTLSGWFKPNRDVNAMTGYPILVHKRPWLVGGYMLGFIGNVSRTDNGTAYVQYCFGGSCASLYTNTTFKSNNWYYLTGTFDGNYMKIYINGVLDNTSPLQTNAMGPNNGTNLSIGQNFNGSISSVKVWNRALSATEIAQLYKNNKPKLKIFSLQKGLVGDWALDGESFNANTNRTTDKTPYENHGTNYGATLTTDRMGQSDRAMSFDGVDDYVDVDLNNFQNPTTEITVSVWINLNNITGNGKRIVQRGDWAITGKNSWLLYWWTNNKIYFGVSEGATQISSFSTTTFDINKWYHIVGTYNGLNVKLYVDGVQESAVAKSGLIFSNITTLSISQLGSVINGSISNVRVYNRALSADEINILYNSYRPKLSSGSLKKGLVLDMPLKLKYTKNETAGSETMTDRTPYSNDGTNNGANVGENSTSFDGINDYVDPGSSLNGIEDYATEFTIIAWVQYYGTSNYEAFFTKQNSQSSTSGTPRLDFGYFPSTLWFTTYNHSSGNINQGSFTYSLETNKWYQFAFTTDNSGKKIYIDGNLEYSNSFISTFPNSTEVTRIGGDRKLNGSISDVKIYDRALSSTEIKLLYDKGR